MKRIDKPKIKLKKWIYLGPVSIQPGEFVKIAFVFGGAATLDRLQTRRNLTEFILFGIACGACFVLTARCPFRSWFLSRASFLLSGCYVCSRLQALEVEAATQPQ